MVLNWLQSLFLGFVTGFTELLPISSDAHRFVFLQMFGTPDSDGIYRFYCHIGIFLSLLLICRPQLSKFRRQRRMGAGKRNLRQADMNSVMDRKIIKTAVIPIALCFAGWFVLNWQSQPAWFLSLMLLLNGLILYIPQFLPSGNKESLSISGLDSTLTGLAGGFGVVPGISRIGSMVSVLRIRGVLGEYAVNLSIILCIPALIITLLLDIFALFAAPVPFSFALFGTGLLCVITSFAGAYLGAVLMRFLSVKVGFSGFSYYCWGAALFTFIIFLWI